MINFVDGFSRTWAENADGTWTTTGITVGPMAQADAQEFSKTYYPDGFVPTHTITVPVPQSVPAWKAKAACYLTPASPGPTLLDNITAAVSAHGGVTLLAFDGAATWERNSDFISALSVGLSLTSAQIDALFVQAAQISG